MFRRIWKRIEPWLTRAGHIDLLFFRTGIGPAFYFWAAPVIGSAIGVGWAALNHAPGHVLFLVGLASAVLILAATLLIADIREKRTIRATISALPPGAARRVIAQQSRSQFRPSYAVLIALVAGVATSVFWYTLMVIHEQSVAINKTTLVVTPGGRIWPPDPEKNQIFGVDIVRVNEGDLPIVGTIWKHHFEYPKTVMTQEEEDREFASLKVLVPQATHSANTLVPHGGTWVTAQDERFRKDEWDKVLNGERFAYLFIRFNYLVDDRHKGTEFCMYVGKDYPSLHQCIGHNRVIDED